MMRFLKFFFVLVCTIVPLLVLAAKGPIVGVENGLVRGFYEDGLEKFYGIPYAAPPVGNLRWRAPQPPLPFKGTFEATEYGKISIQPFVLSSTRVIGSEDSLTL